MNYLLIGLGNPGKKYASTRHNAGKMLAAWLKAEGRRPKDEGGRIPKGFKIMETDCFMNQSGEWLVKYFARKANTDTLIPYPLSLSPFIIAHDDLDLPLGGFKIHFGRGPRLHKGILSIEQALGTKDFWRVRIGVDNRKSNSEFRIQNSEFLRPSGEEYVLRPFRREEKVILYRAFGSIRDALSRQL